LRRPKSQAILLREMRRDLGQYNLGLGDNDLTDLLLKNDGEAIRVTAKEDDMNRTH